MGRVLQKIKIDDALALIIAPGWATQLWKKYTDEYGSVQTNSNQSRSELSNYTFRCNTNPPPVEKANSTGMSSVRIYFLRQGFSNSTVDILMDSWRVGTEK